MRDLTGAFELSGPTISHHLRVVREAGVITDERRCTWISYRVRTEKLAVLSELFLPAEDGATARDAREASA